MTTSVQSSGSCFSSYTAAKSVLRTCATNSGSALKSSALRLSCPGAFPFLRDPMAAISSFYSIGVLLTYWSVSGSYTSSSTVGGGLFRTSLKFPAHLFSCSASVVTSLLFLSAIGVSVDPRYR